MANPRYAKPGPYITQLQPQDEAQFQSWVKSGNVPFNPSPMSDYDMRGFFQDKSAMQEREARIAAGGSRHFPDTYKTPYHATFSNESKYATPEAPHWDGDRLLDKYGKVIADETPAQIKNAQAISWNVLNPPMQDQFAGQGISAQPGLLESIVRRMMGR
jgi:hypothetical protein